MICALLASVSLMACSDDAINEGNVATSSTTTGSGGAGGSGGSMSSSSAAGSGGGGGDASTGAGGAPAAPYVDLGVGFGVSQWHACIIKPDATVKCFGREQPRATPPPGLQAVAIASGHLHNCAINLPPAAETVTCFGYGDAALLVPEGLDAAQLSVGQGTSCAIDQNDAVSCWYREKFDAEPPEGLTAKAVASSGTFTCAIGLDDLVQCWGTNPPELPEAEFKALRIAVAHRESGSEPVAMRLRHACAIRLDNTVVCFGDDVAGEVSEVPDGLLAKEIALGYKEACAITLDGDVVCWGEPPNGMQRPASLRARAIRIMYKNGCALAEDIDELICWGFSDVDRFAATGTPHGESVFVPSD